MLFDEQILSLRGLKEFENSLEFDKHGETPTKAVYAAVENKKVVGVADHSPYKEVRIIYIYGFSFCMHL